EDVIFRYGRFEWSGSFELNALNQLGPLNVEDARITVDSRFPYVGLQSKGRLPNTDITFDLHTTTKYGYVDSLNFGVYGKSQKLASTGLRIDYIFGSASDLAGKQIPQQIKATGSVTDVIVPALKHPQAAYT